MKFNLYNLATHVATPLANGQSFVEPDYAYSIQWVNEMAPVGHGWDFSSQISGGTIERLQNFEYLANHRNDMRSLNLPTGVPVSIPWNANYGQPTQQTGTLTFTLAPNVKPPLSIWGGNFMGVSWPVNVPAMVGYLKSLGMTWARLWIENDKLLQMGDAYWTNVKAFEAAGIHVLLVIQYQYVVNKAMYTLTQQEWLLQQIARSGASGCSFGNEVNTGHVTNAWDTLQPNLDVTRADVYYTGTFAQLADFVTLGEQILGPEGILVVAPCPLNSPAWCAAAASHGVYANAKAVDGHSYHSDTPNLIAEITAYKSFADSLGLPCFITEFNRRQAKGETQDQWVQAIESALNLIKPLGVTAMMFSIVPAGDNLDPSLLMGPDAAVPNWLSKYYQAALGVPALTGP